MQLCTHTFKLLCIEIWSTLLFRHIFFFFWQTWKCKVCCCHSATVAHIFYVLIYTLHLYFIVSYPGPAPAPFFLILFFSCILCSTDTETLCHLAKCQVASSPIIVTESVANIKIHTVVYIEHIYIYISSLYIQYYLQSKLRKMQDNARCCKRMCKILTCNSLGIL